MGLVMLALPASALAGHHHDWDDHPRPLTRHDQGWHRGWFTHQSYRGSEPWGYPRLVEDEDEDECNYRPPGFLEDDDEDEGGQPPYGASYYGPPLSFYQAEPPAGYSLLRQRDWLLQRRQRAYYVLALMRARHDRHAAHRIEIVIRSLNARIARVNQLLAGGGYAAPYYDTGLNPYAGGYPYGAGLNPYGPYDPAYQSSPILNALTSVMGPLLGQGW